MARTTTMGGTGVRGTTRAAIALAAAALLAACGGGGTSDDATPTAAPTTPTGLFPSGLGSSFKDGSAHVELSGDLDLVYDVGLSVQTSIFNEAGAALSFADATGRTLGVAGQFEEGAPQETSSTLVITVTVVEPEIQLFISQAGECTVEFEQADAEAIRGSFECTGLSGSQGGRTVDATGTFEATK